MAFGALSITNQQCQGSVCNLAAAPLGLHPPPPQAPTERTRNSSKEHPHLSTPTYKKLALNKPQPEPTPSTYPTGCRKGGGHQTTLTEMGLHLPLETESFTIFCLNDAFSVREGHVLTIFLQEESAKKHRSSKMPCSKSFKLCKLDGRSRLPLLKLRVPGLVPVTAKC